MTYTSVEVIVIEIDWVKSRIQWEILFISTGDHRWSQLNQVGRDAGWSDAEIGWSRWGEFGWDIHRHCQLHLIDADRQRAGRNEEFTESGDDSGSEWDCIETSGRTVVDCPLHVCSQWVIAVQFDDWTEIEILISSNFKWKWQRGDGRNQCYLWWKQAKK